MPGYLEGILNQVKNQIPKKNEFDISRTNDLGFSSDYGKSLTDALDQIYQRQVSEATQQQAEQSGASGDFNPNLSNYYATKGAREAQSTGKVKALESARGDEYNRFNVMNAINNYGLQKGYLDLQKQMYEDSKPGWLDDVLGGLGQLSNIVPFFNEGGEIMYYGHGGEVLSSEKAKKILHDGTVHGKPLTDAQRKYFGFIAGGGKPKEMAEGGYVGFDKLSSQLKKKGTTNPDALSAWIGRKKYGKQKFQKMAVAGKAGGGSVEDSDYFLQEFGGGIPMSEINSNTEYNGDNTLIKAQPGEVIQSNPAGDLMGRENLKTINEAGKMADNLFANAGSKMAGAMKPMGAGMMPASPVNNVPQNQTLGQKFGEMIKGMFRSNPQGATKMEAGGDVPSPYDEQINRLAEQKQGLISQLGQATDDTAKSQIQNSIDRITESINALEQQKQQWRLKQNPSNQLQADGGSVMQPQAQDQPKIRKISIEEKPLM